MKRFYAIMNLNILKMKILRCNTFLSLGPLPGMNTSYQIKSISRHSTALLGKIIMINFLSTPYLMKTTAGFQRIFVSAIAKNKKIYS